MIKNATIYRMSAPVSQEDLNAALAKFMFTEPGKREAQSMGFIPYSPETDLAHQVGAVIVGALRVDKKQIPSSAVKQFVAERCAEIEAQQGFKPGRKQTKEIKEQVIDELLARALCATKRVNFYIWEDLLLIDSTSGATCDTVIGALAKCLDPFPVAVMHTVQSPATAMTSWLVSDEPPDSFSVDQEVEMRASTEARSSVRWLHESVRNDEVQTHYASGKACTKMALTWADKISFVLNEKGVLSRIKPLDVISLADGAEVEEDDLDGRITLHAGEIYTLAKDMIDALGGEYQH